MQESTQSKQSARRRGPVRITVPSRSDRFLAKFTEVIGGPLGRHSAPGQVNPGLFTVERVLIIMTVIGSLLMLLAKNPCRVNGWGGSNPYDYFCYTDWVPLFGARGFADNPFAPFAAGADFEYPVLMSAVASVVSALVPQVETGRSLIFFDMNLLLVSVLWLITVLCTMKMCGRRPWDAAFVAIAPGIILTGSINWDMWAVALLAGGMLAFARGHSIGAGVLIGLGTAMKIYPFFILGAILVLALRTGRWSVFYKTAGFAAGTWALVNLPYALAFPSSFAYFFSFSSERGAGLSSFWHVWNIGAKYELVPFLAPETISRLGIGLFFLCCVGVAVLALAAPERPRLASLAFLIIASFVMVNKVYSPQFIVWLIPLFALALPRWKEFTAWMLVEVAHFYGLWAYLGSFGDDKDIHKTFPELGYVLLVFAHMIMLGFLMYRVVRTVLDPLQDPVRIVGQDDPQAGGFAGADDKFTLSALRGNAPRKEQVG
ncbi:glycosyltransferase 87 family protein [Glutamicibacter endophyticus]